MLVAKRVVTISSLCAQRNLIGHSVAPFLSSVASNNTHIKWTHYNRSILNQQYKLPQSTPIRTYSVDQNQQQPTKQDTATEQVVEKVISDVSAPTAQTSQPAPTTAMSSTGEEEINKENLSSEELLLKLAKKSKTAHLLKPKTLNEKVSELGQKGLEILVKTPGWLIKYLSLTITKSWEFAKNPSVAKEWWERVGAAIKRELHHYVYGFKLFGADVAYGAKLVGKLTTGNSLSRRERTQLEKTAADLFRLVPFLVIIIVPFMELALPILLKLFPNMLPSQFDSKLKKEEELKKTIKIQLEIAKFLQDTVEAMAHDLKKSESADTVASARELDRFIENVRKGEPVKNEDIIRFAKLFSDEITLDNISRAQLVAMCKYMNLSPYGTDAYLRMRLRGKLRKLKADDRFIHWEGVNSLSLEELMFACQERGMKIGIPKNELRHQLKEWLELSLDKNVPASLLILSRAFTYTDRVQSEEAIKMALGTLPDDVVQEVSLESPVASDDKSINKLKLDSLKRQQKLIEQEEVEFKKRMEDEKKKGIDVAAITASKPATVPMLEGTTLSATDALQQVEDKDLKELITVMAYASSMTNERAEFDELLDKYSVTVGMTKEMAQKSATMDRLNSQIANLLRKLDEQIDEADMSIGAELNVLDKDKDGVITVEEIEQSIGVLKDKPKDIGEIIQRLDRDGDGKISIKELVLSIKEARLREKSHEAENI